MVRSRLVPPFATIVEADLALDAAELGDPIDVDLDLHFLLPRSREHGPGLRSVVWFQGCSLGCRGCSSPATHDGVTGDRTSVREVFRRLTRRSEPTDGVTITGGEPFEQPKALLGLLRLLATEPRLTVIVSTGLRLEEVEALEHGPEALSRIDVLLAGRYERHLRESSPLLGSANRRIHVLTSRLSYEDVLTSARR